MPLVDLNDLEGEMGKDRPRGSFLISPRPTGNEQCCGLSDALKITVGDTLVALVSKSDCGIMSCKCPSNSCSESKGNQSKSTGAVGKGFWGS